MVGRNFVNSLALGQQISPNALQHCCTSLIMKTIETNGLTFLEVCAPRDEDGGVLPMGY
jgi:hypothetical protein